MFFSHGTEDTIRNLNKQNIPVFILAGGMGTRISEETSLRPKPMVEIGDIPILIHLMRHYYRYGFNDFVICAGYKSWEIKQYFLNYEFRVNSMEIDHRENGDRPGQAFARNIQQEKWRVRVLDTGLESMTGCRVSRAFDEISRVQDVGTFALTYGDGLANVNLDSQLAYHLEHKKIGTVLGVRPLARFGELNLRADNIVESFKEKPQGTQGAISGGFFFLESGFRDYLSDEPDCILEREPLARLAADGELVMYMHEGFWQPMDTLRDKKLLQDLWDTGSAPWLNS